MWAERADTLSDLPPPTMPAHPALSRARVSKPGSSSAGGVSKQEHRLLIAAKASVGAVIEEDRRERLIAKRRTRKCVRFLYYAFKVVGVIACVFTSLLNVAFVYVRRHDLELQDRLIRCYLVAFGLGGVLAELDTPFAKANFRAMQKWWFKAPFYVFMAWLCFDVRTSRGTVWLILEAVSFVALQAMAVMSVVLNVCLREVLERSGALGKKKKSRRLRSGAGGTNALSSRGGTRTDTKRGTAGTGGLGVSSFRERDRRRPRLSPGKPTLGGGGTSGGGEGGSGGGDRTPPEMVPERAGLLPPPPYNGGMYGTTGEGGGIQEEGGWGGGGNGGGGGFGDAISGKIKSWWEGGGGGPGGVGDSPRTAGEHFRGAEYNNNAAPPVSPAASVSTTRSGKTNWWEDSDGEDDGSNSFVSLARDDNSDAGSVMSGFTSVSAGGRMEDNRLHHHFSRGTPGSNTGSNYRRGPPSVASSGRRSLGGGSTRSLEQRPSQPSRHRSEGPSAFAGTGSIALTAQALARNDAPSQSGKGPWFGGSVGAGSNYGGGSAHEGSVVGGGSLQGVGTRRSGNRRRFAWGDQSRSVSIAGDEFGSGSSAGAAPWAHSASAGGGGRDGGGGTGGGGGGGGGGGSAGGVGGGVGGATPEYDSARAVSELTAEDERGDEGRYPRATASSSGGSRRTPGIQDYTPF